MKTLFALISITLSLFVISSASAQALYWDPGQTLSATAGGSGNWDTASSLWFNQSADVAWSSGDDAFFEGTGNTVTLQTGISAGDIYFTNVTGNYYITNATGAEVLTVANTIDTGGGEHTIAAPLANSGTLNKNGAGRLHLTAANSLSTVMINQGSVSDENNNGLGSSAQVTVADGAALEFNSGTNDLSGVYNNVTINGSGITNSGALRNLSGVTTFYGQIVLGENNSMIYADSGSALVYDGEGSPLTDNGNGYNLIISGNGTGNVHLGSTISIGGTLIVEGPASCYTYLNGFSPTDWKSTYVSTGATLYVENNNSFGTSPATLMTTNCIVDGGAITSGGTYTMFANDGITVTTNGGTLTCNSGTWTTCNIYSSNTPVTLTGSGSFHPGGAAGTTLGTINLGMGAFIKGGSGDCNMGYANPSLEIYSNIVLNGGSLSFNYDSSGGTSSLGAVPSSLNPSNIWFNGGSMHVGHSTTIAATRGIYVASGGGTIEDVVSSGGTVTINSPISGPGSMSFPDGHGGTLSTIILAANNTYAGTTTIGISNVLTVGNGSTTGTLGTGDTTANGPLKFNRTGTYTYGGAISGNSNLVNSGSGVIALTGKMTYVGPTTISAGTLLIDNTNGSSAVTVSSGGTLGGTGTFGGPVTVIAGGKLALAGTTLSFSNNLSIAGNITVNVNKSLTPSNGMAIVTGTLTRSGTGTLVVTNLGPSLAAGDTFQLFSQPLSGGGTMAVSGGGAGVVWNNNLAVDGTISVQSVLPPSPRITNVQISNGNIILSGSNGPDSGTYYLLSSTNVMLPLSQWTSILTNTFLSNGQFSISNPITAGTPQQFYLLQVP